jgi:arylsulfatase A-like enzyme
MRSLPDPLGRLAARALCAAVLIAAGRGALVALRAYTSVGDWTDFALRAAVGTFVAFAALLLPALLALAWLVRARPTPVRLAAGLAAAVLAFLVASFRLPADALYTPDFESGSGPLANAGLAALALVAAWVWTPRLPAPGLRVFASAALLLLAGALGWSIVTRPAPAAWPARPNLVLISLDTTRADALGCYGYERETTPHLDAFAEQALRFERAYAVDCWTLTTHMSMLTGLTPSVHGVDRDKALSPFAATLPQLLSDAGYTTLGVVDDCTWLDPRFGFARGFDVYRRVDAPAAEKVDQALSLLDDAGDGPFFLFAHFFDAHSDWERAPYEAAPEDAERLAGWYTGDFTGCTPDGTCGSQFLMALNQGEVTLSAEDLRFVRALYDAGLRTLDRQLGRLFDELAARGLLENTVIVVTADHGEEFLDHGKVLHTQHHEECVHIPLLVRTPATNGAVSDALVSQIDLLPTFLDYAGSAPGEVQGRSLRELIDGRAADLERAYVTTDKRGTLRSVRARAATLVALDDGWYVAEGADLSPVSEDTLGPTEAQLLEWLAREQETLRVLRERYARGQARTTISAAEQADLAGIGYGGGDDEEP